jgi:hypothetical protein
MGFSGFRQLSNWYISIKQQHQLQLKFEINEIMQFRAPGGVFGAETEGDFRLHSDHS